MAVVVVAPRVQRRRMVALSAGLILATVASVLIWEASPRSHGVELLSAKEQAEEDERVEHEENVELDPLHASRRSTWGAKDLLLDASDARPRMSTTQHAPLLGASLDDQGSLPKPVVPSKDLEWILPLKVGPDDSILDLGHPDDDNADNGDSATASS